MLPRRVDDRLIISRCRLAVARPHSAISAMERPQPVQTSTFVFSLQISLHGDGGCCVMTASRIKPLVPPDRCWQLMGDFGSIWMCGVDKNVSVQPRRYRRDNEDCRLCLFDPSKPVAFADCLTLAVPTGMLGSVEDFVAGAIRNCDADIMLAFGNYRAGMDQLFEHRSRVIFGRIDERAGGCVPPPRIEPCTLAVIDRMRALGIADTKTGQNAVGLLPTHTPPL